MSKGFIKLNRDALELLENDPDAFLLVCQIALRARRINSKFSKEKLQLGEALLGDFETIGLTEQRYRDVKRRLTHGKIATFKGTNKGTIGKLVDNSLCDINLECHNDQINDQKNERITTQQRTKNDPTTTNKEVKKLRSKEELTIVRSPPPTPKSENGGGGGGKRKIAFIYEGSISKKAYAASELSAKHEIPIRPDIIQRWIDDYGIDAVRLQFQATIAAVKKGKQIAGPAAYLSKRLINNHLTLEQQKSGEEYVDRSASAQC